MKYESGDRNKTPSIEEYHIKLTDTWKTQLTDGEVPRVVFPKMYLR